MWWIVKMNTIWCIFDLSILPLNALPSDRIDVRFPIRIRKLFKFFFKTVLVLRLFCIFKPPSSIGLHFHLNSLVNEQKSHFCVWMQSTSYRRKAFTVRKSARLVRFWANDIVTMSLELKMLILLPWMVSVRHGRSQDNVWFQQDGAMYHVACHSINLLCDAFNDANNSQKCLSKSHGHSKQLWFVEALLYLL